MTLPHLSPDLASVPAPGGGTFLARLALVASGLALAAVTAAPALAQEVGASENIVPSEPEPGSDDFHEPIVVTAAGVGRLDLLAGTSVLSGIDLQRRLDSQLGEVLASLPGVSASSFAPGASRPVLRGFGGERVRVLTDGVGSIDAASTSDDHAVTIDPLIAQRIEVLRGPAALLYGSQAIGGAVNVITRRIPPSVPDEPVHVDLTAALDNAHDRREAGLSLDVPLGSSIAFHVDGSFRRTEDARIPGFVASEALREELLADAAHHEAHGEIDEAGELRELAGLRGTLPGSFSRTHTFGSGLAWFSGDSNIGASFSYFDTDYGVPTRPGAGHHHHGHDHDHHHDHDHDAGGHHHHGDVPVTIGMRQYRADLRGVLDLGGGAFNELRTRWGYSNYTHTEFEGGEVGTVFDVEGVEGRVELIQSPRGDWGGSIGAQFAHQDFSAVGHEAFVPSNTADSLALFALQELAFDPFELQLGGRYERTDIDAHAIGLTRGFDAFSGALGVSYGVADGLRIGLNASRAERAPSAQELFANGPHIATQQFEFGNDQLGKEGSWKLEAYARGRIGPAQVSLAAYRNWFDGFIFLQGTGEEADGLSVFRFLQQDADQWGIEGEIAARLFEHRGFSLLGELKGDYVRATLADGTPVPRMPPLSLTGAIEGRYDHFDLRAELQWFDKQSRLAPFETPTDSFAFVNLSLAWHPIEGSDNVTLILQANNLFDQEGRRHASHTKDFVPLTGRNVRLSARLSF